MNFDRLILALVNAHYNWMLEEGIAPQILVNTQHEGVIIPKHLKMNPTVILRITMAATSNLSFNETNMTFNAGFNGQLFACTIPLRAIIGWPVDIPPNGDRAILPCVNYPNVGADVTSQQTAPPPAEPAKLHAVETADSTSGKVVSIGSRKKKT